jgi:glycosyltransferase involved in cell wall biosynthesis
VSNNGKIIFLINKLGIGGAEKVFVQEINLLIADGHDVFLGLIFGKPENQLLLKDLVIGTDRIYFAQAKSLLDWRAFWGVVKFLRINHIQKIYSTLNEANIWSRLIKLVNWNTKVVMREANVADHKPFKFKFFDCLFNWLVKYIVCVSEEVKASLCKYQPFYCSKMTVIMNGVEIPEKFKQYPDQPAFPLKVLNVGSLLPKKGQKFLIEACALVNQQMSGSVTLTIVGSGPEYQNLYADVTSLGLESLVKIMPAVSFSDISNYYLTADIFVLSSIWEGCPNVLLEAMAHGLVVISTSVSGASQIIGTSQNLVPLADPRQLANAIIDLINDRQNFGQTGYEFRERVKLEFSYDNHIKKLLTLMK